MCACLWHLGWEKKCSVKGDGVKKDGVKIDGGGLEVGCELMLARFAFYKSPEQELNLSRS